jgi:hypothetical protein
MSWRFIEIIDQLASSNEIMKLNTLCVNLTFDIIGKQARTDYTSQPLILPTLFENRHGGDEPRPTGPIIAPKQG